MTRRLLAFAFLLALATPVHAAPHVTGSVNTIQRPLAGAEVIVLETGTMVRTDSLGHFDVGELGPGVYSLRIVAVGYMAAAGTVSVANDGASPPSSWLLKPLHPEGQGLTHGLVVSRSDIASARAASATEPDTGLARPGGAPMPPPAPPQLAPPVPPGPDAIAPVLGLYLTPEEASARGDLPGPLGELLPQIATADSLTAVSAGTSEPGPETWAQWSDRLGAWIVANPGHARVPLARRAVAYARTRRALSEGRTWGGYQAARTARDAVGLSRLDTTNDAPGAAFLDSLRTRLDAVFVPGSSPPKPVAAPRHRPRHHRAHRATKH